MRRTLTSVAALGLAFGLSHGATAQEAATDWQADEDRLTEAGFKNARVLHDIEIARVTGDDGETYHVVGGRGLDALGGMRGTTMDRAGMAQQDLAADPAAEDPAITEDLAADPAAEDPALTEDLAADPAAEDPAITEDLAADPAAEDPAVTDDLAADPAAEDPAITEDLAADPAAEDPAVTDDLAADQPDPGVADPEFAAAGSLEEQLSAAGIQDYEILADARIAEVMVGEGDAADAVYVIYGLDEAAPAQ